MKWKCGDIQIYGDTEKVRESHICILLEMHVIYLALCSIAVAHINNSKSNVIIFIRNLLRVFSPPIIIFFIEILSIPVQKNLHSPKLCCMYLAFCSIIHLHL